MTIATLLMVMALIQFVLAAFNVSVRAVNMTAAGLATLTASLLVAGGVLA